MQNSQSRLHRIVVLENRNCQLIWVGSFNVRKIIFKGGLENGQIGRSIILQMVMDTIRVIMVVCAFGFLVFIVEAISFFAEFLTNLIVKGCKAIWRFIKKLINRPEISVATGERDEEV